MAAPYHQNNPTRPRETEEDRVEGIKRIHRETEDPTEKIRKIYDYINKYPVAPGSGLPWESKNAGTEGVGQAELETICPWFENLVGEVEKALDSDRGGVLSVVYHFLNHHGIIHWTLAGASLVGFVLNRIEAVKENDEEIHNIFNLLRSLSNDIRQLDMKRKPDDSSQLEKVEQATSLIAYGAAVCYKHMQRKVTLISRIQDTFRSSSSRKELQQLYTYLKQEYDKLSLSEILRIGSNICGPYTQHPIEEPTAVGIVEPREKVIDLLDFGRGKSAFAVSLFGMGGIGKTTLGDAVYHELETLGRVKRNDHCKITLELEEVRNKVTKLQRIIWEKLSGTKIPNKIADAGYGRELLKKLFEEKKQDNQAVLIYLDNIPSGRFLSQLFPKGNCLPSGSRMLVTTRFQDVCSALEENGPIEYCRQFAVEGLDEATAISFLNEKSKGRSGREASQKGLEDVANVCQGLPLALQLAAAYIKKHDRDPDDACRRVAADMKSGEKEDLFPHLKFMIEGLDSMPKARRAFNDIVRIDGFRNELRWEEVGVLVGGEDVLEELQERCLVTRRVNREYFLSEDFWSETGEWEKKRAYVWVHDLLLATGRKLLGTADHPPHDIQISVDADTQPLHGVLEVKDPSKVEWLKISNSSSVSMEELHSMRNIRVLQLDNVRLQGSLDLKTLQFLSLRFTCLEFTRDLKLPNSLKCLSIDFSDTLLAGVGSLSKSLERLELRYVDISSFVNDLCKFNQLKYLQLEKCRSTVELPNQFSNLKSLRHLGIVHCSGFTSLPLELGQMHVLEEMYLCRSTDLECPLKAVHSLKSLTRLALSFNKFVTLPEGLGQSTCLKKLWLNNCECLTNLPKSFSNLLSLRYISLKSCKKLEALPSDFGKLSSLQKLLLDDCKSLTNLPNSFSGLLSLTDLSLNGCEKLEALPSDFGKLSSLQKLVLDECTSLTNLPNSFSGLLSLTGLSLKCCKKLEALPSDFEKLSSLRKLLLNHCESLTNLPNSFSGLLSLTVLSLIGCENLESLPSDFGTLTSLQILSLDRCKSLTNLPKSFSGLLSLTNLSLSGCQKLEALPSDFEELSSLQELNLDHCKSLTNLRESFLGLLSLTDLSLSGCEKLESLPSDFGKLSSLQILSLDDCKGLTNLPNSFSGLLSLTDLSLGGCEKLESLPSDFGKLSSLQSLSLWHCKSLTNLPNSFSGLLSLTDLFLIGCKELESLPPDFGKLSSLQILLLDDCESLTNLPNSVSGLLSLTDLSLGGCQKLESLPSDFGKLTSLDVLNLEFCESLTKLPESFSSLPSLTCLHLDGCKNLKARPSDLGKVMAQVYLRVLRSGFLDVPDYSADSELQDSHDEERDDEIDEECDVF